MLRTNWKLWIGLIAVLVISGVLAPSVYSEELKIGYVDLRRAFYEYEKAKNMENELNELTEVRKNERNQKIETITKLREESELLTGDAKTRKEKEIDAKLTELQEFDHSVRQALLNKKNDMFREVIDDIQKVVDEEGEKAGYTYILDSRNIMYAEDTFDLTDTVIEQLNKK